MPKISIIMPVYNGEQYLETSINSVLEQTFKDFELICVNDSSKDNSEDILKAFSLKDIRVKYYTKENEGPGIALNFGVAQAQGEYLCFIDQDDKYNKKYLEIMLNSIEQNACNMSICNAYFWEDEQLRRIPYYPIDANAVNIAPPPKKKLFSKHYFPQWTKIVKRQFWLDNNIKFPDRKNKAHDVPVHYELISLCNKVGYVKDCIYHHRVHPDQISQNFDPSLYNYYSTLDVLDWLKENNISNKKKIKDTLKYLIKISAQHAVNTDIHNKLTDLVSKNYSFVEGIKLKNYIHRYKKRLLNQDCFLDRCFSIRNEYSADNRKHKIIFFCGLKLKFRVKNRKSWKCPPPDHNKRLVVPEKIKINNVGEYSYCASQPIIVSPQTQIGKFCSLGQNIQIGCGDHPINYLTTSPYFYFDNMGFKTSQTNSHNEFWNYAPVIIGNDVWIGDHVKIKNGIKIGDGAIIGIGAIVTKDVPPYAIVAGVPAKIIRYRFDEHTISKLLQLKWWDLDFETLKQIEYDNPQKAIAFLEKIRSNNELCQ